MKIQTIPQQQIKLENKNSNNIDTKNNPQFTGAFEAFSLGLRFLDTNQAIGANAVDLCSMVIPRTTVDFVNRGPAAGAETARREASGTVNHSLFGLYGTMAALAFAVTLNNTFGVRADKIFADNETYDIIGKIYHNKIHDANSTDKIGDTLTEVFKSISTSNGVDEKSLNDFEVENIVKSMKKALNDTDKQGKGISKEAKQYLVNYIMQSTGSESNYKLKGFNKETTANLPTFIENIFKVSKALTADKVVDAFKKESVFENNAFIKGIKNVNKGRTILGVAIGSIIGMSIQPLNIYITKKKTGSDGFVGVEGREKDNSAGFKGLKTAVAGVFTGGVLADLLSQKGGLLKNLQFKGLIPTLNQLKLVYGLTIASRFMAARDKDELREAVVKDTLGFLNWLVLGNIVAKGVALGLDKDHTLLKNPAETSFFKKTLKTRDEVMMEAMKKMNISSVTPDGKALKFSDMLKKLPAGEASKAVRKQLRVLNIAQISGYLYSCLILGVGLPKLNIYMTNKSEEKRQAKLAAQKAQQLLTQDTNEVQKPSIVKPQTMLPQANMKAFLAR